MIHKPDLEPSFTEQMFRFGGYLTLGIGLLFIVAGIVAAKYAPAVSPGEDMRLFQGFVVGYGALVGVLVMISAPALFAIAEVLARLRRQEEREMLREWQSDRDAEDRARLAARAQRPAAIPTANDLSRG